MFFNKDSDNFIDNSNLAEKKCDLKSEQIEKEQVKTANDDEKLPNDDGKLPNDENNENTLSETDSDPISNSDEEKIDQHDKNHETQTNDDKLTFKLLPEKNSQIQTNWKLYCTLFAFSTLFVLKQIYLCGTTISSSGQIQSTNQHENDATFETHFNMLKEKYPNQTYSFWNNIESSFKHSIFESGAPSIVLLVTEKSTNDLASRLTTDLFDFFLKFLKVSPKNWKEDLVINPSNDPNLLRLIENQEFEKTKKYVDNKLEKIFSNGYKFALVRNMEKLPATTMLLFYTYGDDLTNSKYPSVLILMCLELDDVKLESSQRNELLKSRAILSEFVESYLYNLWSSSMHEDQLRPIFSRIANNVIFFNNGI